MWFDAARRLPSTSIDLAIDRLTLLDELAQLPDTSYYLYVLHALKAMEGSTVARVKTDRLLEECRKRTANLPNAKFSLNWIGHGHDLTKLVFYRLLGQFDQEKDFYEREE